MASITALDGAELAKRVYDDLVVGGDVKEFYTDPTTDLQMALLQVGDRMVVAFAGSDDISQSMKRFKSYTAKALLELLHVNRAQTILDQLAFYKKAHKSETSYQIWQEGSAFKLIQSEAMMRERINYIHNNPVKRGYVDEAAHWRYSSARNYEDKEGLINVERMW